MQCYTITNQTELSIAGCKIGTNSFKSTYKSYQKAINPTDNTNTRPLIRTISHGGTQTRIAAMPHFADGMENSFGCHRKASM